MNIFERLDRHSIRFHITIGILLMLIIGLLDYQTGYEMRMDFIYLFPIVYLTWFVSQKIGMAASVLSLILIQGTDYLTGKNYYRIHIELWNMVMYFAFFVVVIALTNKLRDALRQRESLIVELQRTLHEVKELKGILPICANCKKIRDDEGYWQDVAVYISKHTNAEFTHGLCKECAVKLYPEFVKKE